MICKRCGASIKEKVMLKRETGKRVTVMYCEKNCDGSKNYLANYDEENGKEKTCTSRPINIVFDGPPGHESGIFAEVETDDGASIQVGEWIERPDGLFALRITELPN